MGVFLTQIVDIAASFYDFFMYIGLPLLRTIDELLPIGNFLTYYNPLSQTNQVVVVNGFAEVLAMFGDLLGIPGDTLLISAIFMALAISFGIVLAIGIGKLVLGFGSS